MAWDFAFNIKPGDLLRCTSTKLKYYDFDSVYKVAEYSTEGKNAFKVRMESSKSFVSCTNFAPADIKEVRAEKIRVLNGGKPKPKNLTGRKIDRNKNLDEKKFKLFEILLARWFTDKKSLENGWKTEYRNYDEYLEKIITSDKIFGLELKDFDDIKDMTVSEAFDLYLRKRTLKNTRT